MAILIVVFGAFSPLRTPTDIFPNIGIPVISAVWSYTGLSPDDMSGRIIAPTNERFRPRSMISSTSNRSRFPALASSKSTSSRT